MENTPISTLPDLLRPGLGLVFVGINPGSYSAAKGHYYAKPGNLFWWALGESGIVEGRVTPEMDVSLIERGIGFTDVAKRPSNAASDLSKVEFAVGAATLIEKLKQYQPLVACFNGIIGLCALLRAECQTRATTRAHWLHSYICCSFHQPTQLLTTRRKISSTGFAGSSSSWTERGREQMVNKSGSRGPAPDSTRTFIAIELPSEVEGSDLRPNREVEGRRGRGDEVGRPSYRSSHPSLFGQCAGCSPTLAFATWLTTQAWIQRPSA